MEQKTTRHDILTTDVARAGEDYMKARMYTLGTARFPQIDPAFGGAGDPQNWNAYIYVGNSPVGASDPTGMMQAHESMKGEVNHPGQVSGAPTFDALDFTGYNGAGSTFSQEIHAWAQAQGFTDQQITYALQNHGIGLSASNTSQGSTGAGVVTANADGVVHGDSSFTSFKCDAYVSGANPDVDLFVNADGFFPVMSALVTQQNNATDPKELALGIAVVGGAAGNSIVFEQGSEGTKNSAPAKPSSFLLYRVAGAFATDHNHGPAYNPMPSGKKTTGDSGDIEYASSKSGGQNTIAFVGSRAGVYAATPGGQCIQIRGSVWQSGPNSLDQLKQYEFKPGQSYNFK